MDKGSLMIKSGIYIFITMIMLTAHLSAKGVAAGTAIINVAQLSYDMNGTTFNVSSNTIVDTVDQIIELDMVCQENTPVIVQKGETQKALTFLLSNTGNGTDRFSLTFDTNDTTVQVSNRLIYLDDGDGVFNSATDTQITDINLSADANATLFFVSDIPSNASWSTSSNGIEATSTVGGSGIPGTVHPQGSYDAIDGFKGGVDSDLCTYQLLDLGLNLVKTATLSSPDLYIGTTIHYTIVASVEGIGTLDNVVITDVIPAGTSYVANTLVLDGTAISDATHISGTTITVPVGNMTQTSTLHPTHTLTFDVVVQ